MPAPKNIEDLFTTPGPDGTSVAEHTGAAISMIATLQDALRTTTYNVPEALSPEVATAARNAGSGPWPSSAESGLDSLISVFEQLLEQLERLSANDWNKAAESGSESLTVLALTQGASRVAAERLNAVDKIVTSLAR